MKQILCFGDSNTWGYNPETGNRFPWGVRWTSILQQHLEAEEIQILEEGLCGRTTVFEDGPQDFRSGISALPDLLTGPDRLSAVVMMLGTNDCKIIYHADAQKIGLGIETLLQIIRQRQSQAQILLLSPIVLGRDVWKPEFDPEFDEKAVETSYRLREVYQRIAQKYRIGYLAASDYASPSPADQQHMSAADHGKLASAVERELRLLLKL